MSTPNITLTATLQDVSGATDTGAAVIITLCNFKNLLPRIAGTSMVAAITKKVVVTGGAVSLQLWGNDQITPSGTYYAVSVVDDKNNVVQSGIYEFTGSGTFDLSTATPLTTQPS